MLQLLLTTILTFSHSQTTCLSSRHPGWGSPRAAARTPVSTRLVAAWQTDSPPSSAKKSKSAPRATSKQPTDKAASAPPRRMPRYYAQLELDDEQKQRVMDIQQQFSEREDELRRQLSQLLDEREQQLMKVLTRAQQRKLSQLKEGATSKATTQE
jgi:flagellar motility protein MotE (MotC chaperone)